MKQPTPWGFPGMVLCLALLSSVSLVDAAIQGAPSKPWPALSGDIERSQEIQILSNHSDYEITVNGRIDGSMTRMPQGCYAPQPGWQPDRFIRMENIGETDIVNPWITVNGRGDYRTLDLMLSEAVQGCVSARDSARAIWEWTCARRFHGYTFDKEVYDAVKAFHVYGYTLCSNQAHILADLWKTAGFLTRPGRPTGHSTSEVFYDGAFHMLDGDMVVFCLLRDNKTIASEPDIVRDHDLMKRTHTYGITAYESRVSNEFVASLYSYEGDRGGPYDIYTKHAMHFILRPGEALEWRWSHVGKQYSAGIGLRQWGSAAYSNLRNGKWQYAPPLSSPVYRRGVFLEENMIHSTEDGLSPNLHVRQQGLPASVIWKITSPFVLVGATLRARASRASSLDNCFFGFSTDNKSWTPLTAVTGLGDTALAINFDSLISPSGKPTYMFYIKCGLQNPSGGRTGLDSILIDADIQLPWLSPWELRTGTNLVRYTDQSMSAPNVRIVHSWTDRMDWSPPAPPLSPIGPADRDTVFGSTMTFRWPEAAPVTPGASITDYHFQLSERSDFRWPLSSTFDRLISYTPSAGSATWSTPYRGLINPDTDYWWRIRAKDSKGVWSAWSAAWRFRLLGPGIPCSLRIQLDSSGYPETLSWQAPPSSVRPVAWRVYGSNEQGFSASDTAYRILMTLNRTVTPAIIDTVLVSSNFIEEVTENRYRLRKPFQAFYRIAAVDPAGTISGPSDFIALNRPLITSRPDSLTPSGVAYSYPLTVTHSIGQLIYSVTNGAAFWDHDTLAYSLVRGPEWLAFRDNVLEGIPGLSDTGLVIVTIRVSSNKGGNDEQSFPLRVTAGPSATGETEAASEAAIPPVHMLFGALPNPFSRSAEIRYGIPAASRGITIGIYDVTGRLISLLAEGSRRPGYHTAHFGGAPGDPQAPSPGLYFCRMRAHGFERIIKLIRIE